MSVSDSEDESHSFYDMGPSWSAQPELEHKSESELEEEIVEPVPMSLELYYAALGPPSRAVLLLARALELPLELKPVDIFAGEHLADDFVEMNPAHVVPFLVDGDIGISESCAIMIYLIESYGKDDSLYPKDPKKRAVINQRLFYNAGVVTPRILSCYIHPVILYGTDIAEESIPKVDDAFETLNKYMDGHDWIAGDEITVADYSYVAIVSTAEGVGYDLSPYENVANWLVRCKETMEDYDEINQLNLDQLVEKYEENRSAL